MINDIMCGRKPIIGFHAPTTELQWEVTTFLAPTPSCSQAIACNEFLCTCMNHSYYNAASEITV